MSSGLNLGSRDKIARMSRSPALRRGHGAPGARVLDATRPRVRVVGRERTATHPEHEIRAERPAWIAPKRLIPVGWRRSRLAFRMSPHDRHRHIPGGRPARAKDGSGERAVKYFRSMRGTRPSNTA